MDNTKRKPQISQTFWNLHRRASLSLISPENMADEALFPRYLPEDLIFNILLRLPIRSLLVCTSISKPWNSFIKSSAFISSHLNHNISSRKENDSDLCLLQICSLPVVSGTDSFLLQSKDREMSEYDRLQFPFPSDQSGYQVVSSCNGIVYFTNGRFFRNSYPAQWILWNPAIKKTMVISERHNARALEASGLGFDSKTGDFKVLSVIEEAFRDENSMVHIYSLKANSWKRLPDIDFVNMKETSLYKEMAFVNGVLHFVGLRSYKKPKTVILGFDLADEVFHEIMLPDCISNHYSHHFISTYRDSLAVLWFNDHYIFDMEIWVMKEYGVEGSWTKVSTIRLDSSLDYKDLSISGLVFKDDSHVLFSLSPRHSMKAAGIIFSHDLMSHETKKIEIGGKNAYCYLGNYVESLVLLDQPTEVKTADGNGASGIGPSANEGTACLEEDSDGSDSSLQPSYEQEV